MSIEAMKQALDAMKDTHRFVRHYVVGKETERIATAFEDAMKALCTALAQPEQANPIDTYERAYYEGKRAGIAESEAIKTQPEQEYEYAVCECHRCISEKKLMLYGVTRNLAKMIVCIECGNKRCPKASDHRLACTGSNEVGQEESIYTAQPEQSQTSGYAKKIESLIKERDDLRQALAQDEQEPIAYVTGTYGGHFIVKPIDRSMVLNQGMALYAAPPKREQEPVACIVDDELYFTHEIDWEELGGTLLYTAPPKPDLSIPPECKCLHIELCNLHDKCMK